jgi:pilus assembly protein Flp/PilA
LGQTKPDGGLSHAAGRRPIGRLAARSALAFWQDRRGTTAIEYGLIVSLIFLVVCGSMTVFGGETTDIINKASAAISGSM